jgi:hypothetical protein
MFCPPGGKPPVYAFKLEVVEKPEIGCDYGYDGGRDADKNKGAPVRDFFAVNSRGFFIS